MKDCKESLEEANWNLQEAVDIVKTKGLNVVSGREGKVAAEGAVGVSQGGPCLTSSLVEVNCQTDFVANHPSFRKFVHDTVDEIARKTALREAISVDELQIGRIHLMSTFKENIVVRRWWVEEALDPRARVFTYVHPNAKIGVLMTLLAPSETAVNDPAFTELGNDLVMQIAAMNPLAVSSDRLDSDVVLRQKQIFSAQLAELKKPAAVWPKIMDGKLAKWHTDVCLLNQESVLVTKTSVQQVIKNIGTKLGGEIQVLSFTRCQVGEGIEVKQNDLLQEVERLSGIQIPVLKGE